MSSRDRSPGRAGERREWVTAMALVRTRLAGRMSGMPVMNPLPSTRWWQGE